MMDYARNDTHFLLFIHDLLKNQLLEKGNQFKNLLCAVYDQSKSLCLNVRAIYK
jgi:exosome complex exonuclease RRP6